MKVEHVAFLVDDPEAVADWYCTNLGMRVVRAGGPPANARFLVHQVDQISGVGQIKAGLHSADAAANHHHCADLAVA